MGRKGRYARGIFCTEIETRRWETTAKICFEKIILWTFFV